jgi:hypothetical protein
MGSEDTRIGTAYLSVLGTLVSASAPHARTDEDRANLNAFATVNIDSQYSGIVSAAEHGT